MSDFHLDTSYLSLDTSFGCKTLWLEADHPSQMTQFGVKCQLSRHPLRCKWLAVGWSSPKMRGLVVGWPPIQTMWFVGLRYVVFAHIRIFFRHVEFSFGHFTLAIPLSHFTLLQSQFGCKFAKDVQFENLQNYVQ